MAQRFIWNFEFSDAKTHLIASLPHQDEDELKWEARYFWNSDEIIRLSLIDPLLLRLSHYQIKEKHDCYFLLAKHHQNIKLRHGKLQYKPLIKQSAYAFGFGAKVELNVDDKDCFLTQKQIDKGTEIIVHKESVGFKWNNHPSIKLELSRLEINHAVYFSACVEGRSQVLVEAISEQLLGKHNTTDYVAFLKTLPPGERT